MTASLRTVTLGCKVNQYETELVREGLVKFGYHDAVDDEQAALCVVNTCTVTSDGDSKSRYTIRKLARENPDSRIVVMGCYATRAPDELLKLPNVVEVVTDKRELPDVLQRYGVIDLPNGISRFGTRHRAYVKVQDGCLLRCSYCIIPQVRPHVSSRPLQHIVEEVERLVANGYREVVLTGVHLGHYGVEGNWNKPKEEWLRLSTLLRELVKLPGEFRLRLSSIEATEVTRELISVMAENRQRIAPHLHLCLQSGSDSVLRRMRRRWSSRMFIDRCQMLRDALDAPAITTDIIVGFPGETEEEFQATLETARASAFSKIHIFPYSARKGTPAAEMPGQISFEVKTERSARLADLEKQMQREYLASLVGKPLELLVEGEIDAPPLDTQLATSVATSGRMQLGTTCRYVPLELRSKLAGDGDLTIVIPTAVAGDRLIA